MERENDIIQDSYYLINLFHKDRKVITQLHVQKLMFIFEAYYINVTGENKLYNCKFKAWSFGPVIHRLYKRYKNYGKDDIQLSKQEEEVGNQISGRKKQIMEELYETFKDFSAIELLSFTHAQDSPWKNIWNEEPYSNISKESMKEWFSKYLIVNVL